MKGHDPYFLSSGIVKHAEDGALTAYKGNKALKISFGKRVHLNMEYDVYRLKSSMGLAKERS